MSATVNHPTHIIVELIDSGVPLPQTLNLTAQMELVTEATPTDPWFKREAMPASPTQPTPTNDSSIPITMVSPCRYKVSYTAVSRGKHKLHVQVNDKEIDGSPFTMTVYLDPTQLGHPVRVVTGLSAPYGIAYNSREEMIVSEYSGHRVSIFEIRGQGKIQTFGSYGESPHKMIAPAGVATDDADNIYVSSCHKLQKFTSSGELMKCTGEKGKNEGEFDDPRGLTLYDNEVYVCDRNNHRIQVFDLDLNFDRSINSYDEGKGEFITPQDIKFDTAGNMYVAEWGSGKVKVIEKCGHLVQEFGEGELKQPSSLHIADKYVYVSDLKGHCIVVYDTLGEFVTSFGRLGQNEGEFYCPFCITFCVDGYIHVCDRWNYRVQIF